METTNSPTVLLNFLGVSQAVQFGRSRVYGMIKAGDFPKPIKVGKSSRWLKAEIDAWISKQAAQRTQG